MIVTFFQTLVIIVKATQVKYLPYCYIVIKSFFQQDPRLTGGYENVPTRDIHMTQVKFEPQWLHFLKEYVRPLQELVFTGYYHDVRYLFFNAWTNYF